MNDPTGRWRPTADIVAVQARAQMLARIRAFFAERVVLEVDTPQLSAAANPDPSLSSMAVSTGPGECERSWLNTSPEFHMKRLLAADVGAMYQICHVFRSGEAGRLHNPEFSLLEWYRPGWTAGALMDEVAALVGEVLQQGLAVTTITYAEACRTHAGIDPFRCTHADLEGALMRRGVAPFTGEARFSELLDLLMGSVVMPALGHGELCFLTDYPADQAALARIKPNTNPATADRFELFWQGVELANGYRELTDAGEQETRFREQNRIRANAGLESLPVDGYLLDAMRQGLPDCSGVALGLDRLLMLSLGREYIEDVLSFPFSIS